MYDTAERLQTSITLQDGCFGTATLMRIAALFVPSPGPIPEPYPNASTRGVGQPPDTLSLSSHQAQAELSSNLLRDLSTQPQDTVLNPSAGFTDLPCSLYEVNLQMPLSELHRPSRAPSPGASGDSTQGLLAGSDKAGSSTAVPKHDTVDQALRSDLTSPLQPLATLLGDPGLLIAIEPPLGSPAEEVRAEEKLQEQAAVTAVSAVSLEGTNDTNHIPQEAQLTRLDWPRGASGANQGPGADMSTPRGDGETEAAEPKVERTQQFSLEIVRCKAVCPAKVDAASFTGAHPSPLDHTLYLEVPHFLLQLPLSQPAQHPRPHPVNLNVRHVLNRQQAAVPPPDAVSPSPFAATGQQGTIFSLTNGALYVALPEEFDSPELAASGSEPHTQLPPLLSIPTAGLVALPPRSPPQHASVHSQTPEPAVPTFELEMSIAEVIAKPAQLQTMSASTIRYSTEMDIILGKSPSDPMAPVLAATADPPLQTTADVQQPSQRLSKPGQSPGFAIEASIGMISLQLHSSNKRLPALVLQWQRLSGHYAQAAGQELSSAQTSCGLTWHYLALHLTENPAEPHLQFSLEHVGTLRSGSLLLPGRMTRVHSDPLGGHGPPSSSRSSQQGSGRLTRGSSVHHGHTRRHMAAARTISLEEEFLGHQHSLSRLHVGLGGNGRSGLGGLTGLAEIAAADDDASTPSSPQYIYNNRARLASDSFAEALEEILPSVSQLSLSKASNQQHSTSDNASSSHSGSRSHTHSRRHHTSGKLHPAGTGTSVASTSLSVGKLQRQVPVIQHRSVFMNPAPPTSYAKQPLSPDYASAADSFDLCSASSHSLKQGLSIFHDAPERLNSNSQEGPSGGSTLPEGWSPNSLPPGDRVLLLFGSKGCFAANDGIASSSTDACIACSLVSNPSGHSNSDSQVQSALEVSASDMMLRVYLEVG